MHELVRLELIRESLVAVVNEMRANVIHSSYSSIIYEGQDFSCAIMSADGRQVAQSMADHPTHVFAVPYSTREVAKAFEGDIHEGDIFLHNDPYTGGTHLNDVLLLYPVFHDGQLALFPAVRCHWGDVGGMTPGSISGRVTEVIQEGLRLTPTKICDRGRMNDAYLRLLFDNMRTPAERIGDFNTMVGTAKKAAEHLGRLFRRFGGSALLEGIEELIRRSEAQMRARIAAIPDGVHYNEGYIESNGPTAEPLLARLSLTIHGDEIIADFSGSSLQTMGPTNVGPAMAFNSAGTVIKSFLDPRTPINHGSFAPIRVIAPEGTFVNARYPAPCGGMAEVKHLLDAVMAGALCRAVPEMTIGDHKGCANHAYIAGPKPGGGIYLLYEWPAAGTGATCGQDGNNAVRFYTEGDFSSIHPVETIEASYPLRIERRTLREGSCGDGAFRGGFGLRSEIRILDEAAQLSVISDKNVIPPYGVNGGGNGAGNRFTVLRDGEVVEPSPVPGKVSGFPLRRGDVVREETSGGGGWGDPLARDLERIQRDVALGYLSIEQARRRYGADVRADGALGPDSERLRSELRAGRVRVSVEAASDEMFDGPRRRFLAPADLARRLGVSDGDLVELVNGEGPPLRGWIRLGEAGPDAVRIGPAGLRALDATQGERLELRVVRPAAVA